MQLSTKELTNLLDKFLNLDNSSTDSWYQNFENLKAFLPSEQTTDFYGIICEKEHLLSIQTTELKEKILHCPLGKREAHKVELTKIEEIIKIIERLREELTPIDDKNLRSAIHFINKNLD